MRFNVKPKPKVGDRRIVKRFVLLLQVNDEIRALEMARILQEYRQENLQYPGWVNLAWVDRDDDDND